MVNVVPDRKLTTPLLTPEALPEKAFSFHNSHSSKILAKDLQRSVALSAPSTGPKDIPKTNKFLVFCVAFTDPSVSARCLSTCERET